MLSPISRRGFMSVAAASTLSGWLGRVAAHAAEQTLPKSCILLWMSGGPSHIDTFDPKPEAPDNIRSEFKPIDTSVEGIKISEHLPQLAQRMQHMSLLRSMSTVESDHN